MGGWQKEARGQSSCFVAGSIDSSRTFLSEEGFSADRKLFAGAVMKVLMWDCLQARSKAARMQ
jgi:hypothetical protein